MKPAYTVMCVLEAKPDKIEELKEALQKVVEPSRSEATNFEYRLHQDHNNPARFFLYENWESKEKHALQFEKPYIAELGSKLGDLLAKPFEATFAKEL